MIDPETYLSDDPSKREELVRDRLMTTILRTAGKISFTHDAVAAWLCAQDPKTPHYVKGILIAALAYFVLPIDAIPDFLITLGFADDATVLIAAARMLGDYITPIHRASAHRILEGNEEL